MISPGLSSCEHSLNTMRYADRVKELAANDPTGPKGSDSPDDQHRDSYEENDLATLRSLNVSLTLNVTTYLVSLVKFHLKTSIE